MRISKNTPILLIFCLIILVGFRCSSLSEPTKPSTSPVSQPDDKEAIIQISDAIQRQEFKLQFKESRYKIVVYIFQSEMVNMKIHNDIQPKGISEWNKQLEANIIINGGFFDEHNEPTGYFVQEGEVVSSKTYDYNKSGSLVINNGIANIVDTSLTGLPAVTSSISILQSFPLLIKPGGQPGIKEDSHKLARRTVLAKNANDELLIIIVDQTPVSLFRLMELLLDSDLDIDIALNLDGGPSTGLISTFNEFNESLLPLTPLPQVISVYGLS